MNKIKRRMRRVYTAVKAGWIASFCTTGCVVDDELEEIRPCILHLAEIARLARINEDNQ